LEFLLLCRLESAVPLLRQKIESLSDAGQISIAFPDDGAYKRFHVQFEDYPIIICNKVRDGDKRIVKVKEGKPAFLYPVIRPKNPWSEVSTRSRWVLFMRQHQAHSRNRPTPMDKKKKSLLCFGCDFSGQYSFGKIIKISATRYHILKLKCTKFDFSCGSSPDPAGELTVLPQTP